MHTATTIRSLIRYTAVIALPTQVHPAEREIYLNYILSDLHPKEEAIWRDWPSDGKLILSLEDRIPRLPRA